MSALKMKAKSTTTCKRDGWYPHVSQKSNKISKIPCSMVRVTDEMENLAISSQTSHNGGCSMVKVSDEMEHLAISSQTSHSGGFSINEESSEEHDNVKNQMSSTIDTIAGQDCHSFNGCSGSVVERDSLLISVSSSSDMMSYFDRLDDAHCNLFEAVNKEQIIMAPQVDDNNFPNFQMPDMLNSYVDETCLNWFSGDGITVSDDWRNYNPLPDFEFLGTNLMYDPLTLEDTIEAESYNYVGSCGEFQPKPDSSWFHYMCHQAKPSTEELDIRSSQFDSERVDYSDPETFIKNFLEISDESNLLPALVSKETSKRKNITLVLDLDETLIHSSMAQCDSADFTIQVLLDKEYTVYVRQRPFLRDFLEKVSEMFEIIIFTASKRLYAEKLLDVLDPDKKLFSRRVYRESCIFQDGTYTKDLTVLGLDLAKVFIIDNSPQVFRLQVNNGIPIESWFDDPSDSALTSLLPFLEKLVDVDDVRPIIAEKFGPKNN